MRVIVFAGPSLSGFDRAALPDVAFRGPARCGDVARAAVAGARVIGLVDGLFETTLPPWHKEILWAMSKGARVYGAASMGALRAAELGPFGMIGVGEVFEAFRDGVLEDDDEVAVLHGPAEVDHLPLTEAMVNVRWTVRAAEAAGVLSPVEAAAIVRCAKSVFYKERTWTSVWREAGCVGADAVARGSEWVAARRVDVKRRDAERLLRVLLEPDAGRAGMAAPFIDTAYWERMRRRLTVETGA